MTLIEKQIQRARPYLKTVTPLAYWIIVVYAYFNILFGLSLLIGIDQARFTASLIIVNEIFVAKMWGLVFISIGILKLFALKTNNWNLSRQTLLIGVSIKAAWAVALIVRSFISPGTWLVSLVWLALATIQIIVHIFFMPPSIGTNKQSKGANSNE